MYCTVLYCTVLHCTALFSIMWFTTSSSKQYASHILTMSTDSLVQVPMVLNTSFNLKNQPIVESPEDAVKSLLASEGRIAALFMGLFEVTLRPFPFSDLQTIAAESGMKTQGGAGAGAGEGEEGLSALLAAELGVIVRAKRFYMLEMVSSSGTGAGSGAGAPLRIRIQGTNTVNACEVM